MDVAVTAKDLADMVFLSAFHLLKEQYNDSKTTESDS